MSDFHRETRGLNDAHAAGATALVAERQFVVIGKESVGKSQWIASLTGRNATVGNFRGTTVSCDEYRYGDIVFVDTPGIVRQSDSATTKLALDALMDGEAVVLVAQATHLDDDLDDLLPLAAGKPGLVVVTFWDKVDAAAGMLLERVSQQTGLTFLPIDARRLSADDRCKIAAALDDPRMLPRAAALKFGRRIEPRPGIFESRWGPILAVCFLLAPAIAAVQAANAFAGWADPVVRGFLEPMIAIINGLAPGWGFIQALLVGDYGLLTMGPLLLVWAVPTVVLYAFLLGAYKATGLVDRLNAALHPWVRPLGLAGRDVVRIVMGFGCNVPAVISTRSCSACSRGTCISAIAFGAACSYQLPATMAVFAAAGFAWLTLPFLAYLLITTAIYLRLTSTAEARSPLNLLVVERRSFLQWPAPSALWREARSTLMQFFLQAMPIFALITLAASTAAYFGLLDQLAVWLTPLMQLVNLPGEAALPVVVASIRKDGILLFLDGDGLRTPLTAVQLLTGTYLAGVLLPCLVTALTIAREQSRSFAWRLIARQATAAIVFAMLIAWTGRWFIVS